MKSLVKRLWTDELIETAQVNKVSPSTQPQRIQDENGAIQITLNQDPAATAGAILQLQGRLNPNEPYAAVTSVSLNHANFTTSPFSRIITGVQIVLDMRLQILDGGGGGGYVVAAGTLATVDLME